jgi:L-aminopeptidase/D-esterase-like protein
MSEDRLGPGFAPPGLNSKNDFDTGDPLPQLQRVGTLETPVLQAFRWRLPEIVARTVDEGPQGSTGLNTRSL